MFSWLLRMSLLFSLAALGCLLAMIWNVTDDWRWALSCMVAALIASIASLGFV